MIGLAIQNGYHHFGITLECYFPTTELFHKNKKKFDSILILIAH